MNKIQTQDMTKCKCTDFFIIDLRIRLGTLAGGPVDKLESTLDMV